MQRVDAPAQFALESFARERIGISGNGYEQSAYGFCSIEWKEMRRVTKERFTSVGNLLRGEREFRSRKVFGQGVEAYLIIVVESEVSLGAKDIRYGVIYSRHGNASRGYGFVQSDERGLWLRWQKKNVGAGQNRANGDLCGRIVRCNAPHVESIGNYQTSEAQLAAEQMRGDFF